MFTFLFLLVTGLETVTIAVAITVSLAVAVFLAVTITVAVLALRHVQAIDHRRELRELSLTPQHVDVAETGLRCHVRTADVHAHVSHTADDRRVRNHADRGRVQDDIVVAFLQPGDSPLSTSRATSSVGFGE